jgi:hypothetical protein
MINQRLISAVPPLRTYRRRFTPRPLAEASVTPSWEGGGCPKGHANRMERGTRTRHRQLWSATPDERPQAEPQEHRSIPCDWNEEAPQRPSPVSRPSATGPSRERRRTKVTSPVPAFLGSLAPGRRLRGADGGWPTARMLPENHRLHPQAAKSAGSSRQPLDSTFGVLHKPLHIGPQLIKGTEQ